MTTGLGAVGSASSVQARAVASSGRAAVATSTAGVPIAAVQSSSAVETRRLRGVAYVAVASQAVRRGTPAAAGMLIGVATRTFFLGSSEVAPLNLLGNGSGGCQCNAGKGCTLGRHSGSRERLNRCSVGAPEQDLGSALVKKPHKLSIRVGIRSVWSAVGGATTGCSGVSGRRGFGEVMGLVAASLRVSGR